MVKSPMVIMNSFRMLFRDYKKQIMTKNYYGKMPDLDFKQVTIENVSATKKVRLLKEVHDILGNRFSLPFLEYYIRELEYFFTDLDFQYNVTYMSLAFAAIVLPQNFFYGLLLFDIIYHIDILRNVIKAIFDNTNMILQTTLLITLAIFFFSEFGFFFIQSDFYIDSRGDNGEGTCSTMI